MRFLLLLALFYLAACTTTNNGEAPMDDDTTMSEDVPRSDMKGVERGEPFTIGLGETVHFPNEEANVELRFNRVQRDSRCPANADCVRAGEALADFTLVEGDTTISFTLEVPGMVMEMMAPDAAEFLRVGRFAGALLQLQPYPEHAEDADMPVTATVEMRRVTR
jgi:hypothetical protein